MLVKSAENTTFRLENFEGPLNFLLHLVQKSEVDISEVSLKEIIIQYFTQLEERARYDVNAGAEFVGTTAALLWLKSKMLLPAEEQPTTLEELEESPFSVFPALIEYIHFKQLAKDLSKREQEQKGFCVRGVTPPTPEELTKSLGIENIALQELEDLFQKVLKKAEHRQKIIHEEVWRVSDKMASIRQLRKETDKIAATALFTPDRSKEELIVTFLAILELMKVGELMVAKHETTSELWLTFPEQ